MKVWVHNCMYAWHFNVEKMTSPNEKIVKGNKQKEGAASIHTYQKMLFKKWQ